MDKLSFTFPDIAKVFSCQLPVRVTDLNYGGHLANDSILRLIQEARVQFLQTLGGSEKMIYGAGIILADAQLIFKAESFYGDLLNIDIAIDGWGKCDALFYYRFTREHDGKLIALAKIRTVFFDYNERKILPVPEQLKTHIDIIRSSNEKIS